MFYLPPIGAVMSCQKWLDQSSRLGKDMANQIIQDWKTNGKWFDLPDLRDRLAEGYARLIRERDIALAQVAKLEERDEH